MVGKENEGSEELDLWLEDLLFETLRGIPPEEKRNFLECLLDTTDPNTCLAKRARQILEEKNSLDNNTKIC